MSDTTATNGEMNQQALLASLSFGLPRQSRQLKKEAEKVETDNLAQHGVAKVSVWYFQQREGKVTNDALADLKSHFGYWKREHERLTLPWMGTSRLLAAAIVPQYLDMRSKFEEQAPIKVQEFFAVHPDWRMTAPERMGRMFDEEDFPSLEECGERISWDTTLMPLPEAAQWQRIALINPTHAASEEARLNAAIAKAQEQARLATWQDLIGHFTHIVEVLQKDKARIFDSLITNLGSMLDLMPAYSDLFNDENLTRCAAEAKAALATINPEDLRNDPAIRQHTLKSAQSLLASFGELGRRSFIA